MNISHDVSGGLTALAELKSEGGMLFREHLIKGHLVGTSSLEGMRKGADCIRSTLLAHQVGRKRRGHRRKPGWLQDSPVRQDRKPHDGGRDM